MGAALGGASIPWWGIESVGLVGAAVALASAVAAVVIGVWAHKRQ